MTNALTELHNHIKHVGHDILCATIMYEPTWEETYIFNLPVKHNPLETTKFLIKLDFDYDSGFGTQHITGTIWWSDGSYSTRYEYDGSEGWQHHTPPPIPEELR